VDADPHLPLREDVRLLGAMLGDTLRAQAGEHALHARGEHGAAVESVAVSQLERPDPIDHRVGRALDQRHEQLHRGRLLHTGPFS
jgi:phosphoenolpyruvate carboxylase